MAGGVSRYGCHNPGTRPVYESPCGYAFQDSDAECAGCVRSFDASRVQEVSAAIRATQESWARRWVLSSEIGPQDT